MKFVFKELLFILGSLKIVTLFVKMLYNESLCSINNHVSPEVDDQIFKKLCGEFVGRTQGHYFCTQKYV